MSEPYLKKGCHRVGYVQFREGTDVRNVLNAIDRIEVNKPSYELGQYQTDAPSSLQVKECTLNMSLNTVPFSGKTRENPAMSSSLARMKHDAAQAKAMALALENQLLMSEQERQTTINEGKALEEVAKKESRLLSRGSDVVQSRTDTLIKKVEETNTEEPKSEAELEREKVRIELDQWVSYLRNGLNR